jgi:hypothetical protein
MIKKGEKIIADTLPPDLLIVEDYIPFGFSISIGQYSSGEENIFLQDIDQALRKISELFSFWNLTKFDGIDNVVFPNTNTSGTISALLSGIRHDSVTELFEDISSEIILISGNAVYTTAHNKFGKTDAEYVGSVYVNNDVRHISTLIFDFDWPFGAEWFYNEYAEENRTIVRKAILDFYNSNPHYTNLHVDYQLYGFDLDLESGTDKPVIVQRNRGTSAQK